MLDTSDATLQVPLYALSSAVFAERDGMILILKRAAGEAPGSWYLPGGAVDPGETVEASASRELLEESGLVPSGPLTCVGVVHMHVYGHESLQVLYRCECPSRDVVLSDEHSGARWIDPVAYRDRYFNEQILESVAASSERYGTMLRNIRAGIDAYLEWRRMAGV